MPHNKNKQPMTLEEYHQWCYERWDSKTKSPEFTFHDDYVMGLGLAGEVGEVLEILKKHQRDGVLNLKNLFLELGDVFFYWNIICARYGISPDDVIKMNVKKLETRRARKAKKKKHK